MACSSCPLQPADVQPDISGPAGCFAHKAHRSLSLMEKREMFMITLWTLFWMCTWLPKSISNILSCIVIHHWCQISWSLKPNKTLTHTCHWQNTLKHTFLLTKHRMSVTSSVLSGERSLQFCQTTKTGGNWPLFQGQAHMGGNGLRSPLSYCLHSLWELPW